MSNNANSLLNPPANKKNDESNSFINFSQPPQRALLPYFKNDFLADCLFLYEPDKPVKAHKLVLASRSKLFYTQFKHSSNMELKMVTPIESKYQKATPKDKELFFKILEYFYSNACGEDFEEVLIKGGLTQQNCMKYLAWFSAFQYTAAISQMEDYVMTNLLTKGNCLALLGDFIKLQNSNLLTETFKVIQDDFSEYIKKDKQKLVDLPFDQVLQLLEADSLKVDKEDKVFTFIIDYIDKRVDLEEKAPPHFESESKNAPQLASIELPAFMNEIEKWKDGKPGCVTCWDGISDIIGSSFPDGLSKDPIKRQEQLVRIYTMETPVYHEVNQALRDDDAEQLHRFAGFVNELRNVFETDHQNQIIEPYIGNVYRGISFPDVNAARELYQVGEIFCWPAFTSTSTNKEVTMGFGNVMFEISCFPSKKMLEDDDPEFVAAPIAKWSVYPSEAEILFPPNTKFKIVDVCEKEDSSGGFICKCETIAYDKRGVGFSELNPESSQQKEANGVPKALKMEVKKPSRQLYMNLNLNENSDKTLQKYKLSNDEIGKLLKACRLPYVSHELLMSASQNHIFDEFKPIFIEAISAKLNMYEKLRGNEYHINCNPRKFYTIKQGDGLYQSGQEQQAQLQPQMMIQQSGMQMQSQQQQQQQQSQMQKSMANKSGMGGMPIQNQMGVGGLQKQLQASNKFGGPQSQQQYYDQSQQPQQQSVNIKGQGQNQNDQYQVYYVSPKKNQINPSQQYENKKQMVPNYQQYEQQTQMYKHPLPVAQPISFAYEYDFDENGVFNYLGTQGHTQQWKNPHNLGLCQAFFSSVRAGQLGDFVGKDVVNCGTLNEVNSFMGVDIGEGRQIFPECYSIRNRNSSSHVLLNWDLEVSIDGQVWFVIDKRIHFSNDTKFNLLMEKEREQLKVKGATSTWGIDLNLVNSVLINIKNATMQDYKGFKYFRIVQQGKNSHGSDNLSLSGFELYGKGYGCWDFQNI